MFQGYKNMTFTNQGHNNITNHESFSFVVSWLDAYRLSMDSDCRCFSWSLSLDLGSQPIMLLSPLGLLWSSPSTSVPAAATAPVPPLPFHVPSSWYYCQRGSPRLSQLPSPGLHLTPCYHMLDIFAHDCFLQPLLWFPDVSPSSNCRWYIPWSGLFLHDTPFSSSSSSVSSGLRLSLSSPSPPETSLLFQPGIWWLVGKHFDGTDPVFPIELASQYLSNSLEILGCGRPPRRRSHWPVGYMFVVLWPAGDNSPSKCLLTSRAKCHAYVLH